MAFTCFNLNGLNLKFTIHFSSVENISRLFKYSIMSRLLLFVEYVQLNVIFLLKIMFNA